MNGGCEYYWLIIGVSLSILAGILAIIIRPIIPIVKAEFIKRKLPYCKPDLTIHSFCNTSSSSPKIIESEKALQERKEREQREEARKEQMRREREERDRIIREKQKQAEIAQFWDAATIAIKVSPQNIHNLYCELLQNCGCSQYIANMVIHDLKQNSLIKVHETSDIYVCAFDTVSEIEQVKQAGLDALNIDLEELEIKLAIATEEYEAEMEKLRIKREKEEELRRQERERVRIEREKEEIAARIKEKYRRRQLEKLVRQELIDSGELFGEQPKRPHIPREVVDAVYSRDGGRCVHCGSTENLQLDHIIPFSKGGATTLENLQLLCQKCNLEKSNKIG